MELLLELQGIKGESKAADHPGAIDVESITWSAKNSPAAKGDREGKRGVAEVQDVCFQKRSDVSTPKLLDALVNGTPIPKAEFIFRKAGGKQEEFMRYKLEDVFVSHYQLSSPHGEELAKETVCLNFRKFTVKVAEQTEKGGMKGPVQMSHDLGQP